MTADVKEAVVNCKDSEEVVFTADEANCDSEDADDEEDCDVEFNDLMKQKVRINEWICVGNTVLCRWKDGLYYEGVIEKVDTFSQHCLIRYEDYSIYWTHFKDLHKQLSSGSEMSDVDILCTVCLDGTSKSPNEIVICDICNQGYHQNCHTPNISESILKPDVPWNCRKCVFALAAKEGGAEKNNAIGHAMTALKTSLPYDVTTLCWDSSHYVNQQNTYCYCGGPGEYYSKMLQCHQCLQWFHEACIQALDKGLLYGDHYYRFTCAVCNKGTETVKRVIMKWSDMVALVINNLGLRDDKPYFDLQTEIVPFIQQNSHKLKLNDDLKKMKEKELCDRVVQILCNNENKFCNAGKDGKRKNLWALRNTGKPHIFAPPFAISDNSRCSKAHHSSLTTHSSGARMCSSPSKSPLPYTFVYGACRKGASNYPKPSTKLMDCDKTSTISCAASTSSNSSVNSRRSKREATKRRSPTKMKAKSGSSVTSESRSSSDVDTKAKASSLDAFIPPPENFEGANNPFYDLDNIQKKTHKRKKLTDKEYRIVNPGNSSKLTLQRIDSVSETADESVAQEDQTVDTIEQDSLKGEKFNVLGRRLTKDGKVEYLLEWDVKN